MTKKPTTASGERRVQASRAQPSAAVGAAAGTPRPGDAPGQRQATPARPRLADEQRKAMAVYVARRVPEILNQGSKKTHNELAAQAKGEWMLAIYAEEGNRVGAALLVEVIADLYGVMLS